MDFRGLSENGSVLVSKDANRVQFRYGLDEQQPVQFSLTECAMTTDFSLGDCLPPCTSAPGLNITNWFNTFIPKLNGKPLWSPKPMGLCRNLAIAADGQHILLGTEWWLCLFDKDAQLQWQVLVPEVAWGVNIAGNGKVAVAILGDGTIRWYRLQDGKELVALFPHKNRKSWIVWTPEGYYDVSSGAVELITWHINRRHAEEEQLISWEELLEKYYRPDLIMKVLEEV